MSLQDDIIITRTEVEFNRVIGFLTNSARSARAGTPLAISRSAPETGPSDWLRTAITLSFADQRALRRRPGSCASPD